MSVYQQRYFRLFLHSPTSKVEDVRSFRRTEMRSMIIVFHLVTVMKSSSPLLSKRNIFIIWSHISFHIVGYSYERLIFTGQINAKTCFCIEINLAVVLQTPTLLKSHLLIFVCNYTQNGFDYVCSLGLPSGDTRIFVELWPLVSRAFLLYVQNADIMSRYTDIITLFPEKMP